MGKLYGDYLDQKLIQRDKNRELSKQRGMLPCSNCSRPSETPRGVSHIGKTLCSSCRHERMRVRG